MGDRQRVQLRRTKGYRMPEGTIVCTRRTRYSNPFKVGGWFTYHASEPREVRDAEHAVALFRWWLQRPNDLAASTGLATYERARWITDHVGELHGATLGCVCALDAPCHCDALHDMAERARSRPSAPPSRLVPPPPNPEEEQGDPSS